MVEELEQSANKLRRAKEKLQEDIRKLLLQFDEDTGIPIKSISLNDASKSIIVLYRVRIELDL